jgi:hypothetical protein
VLQYQGHCSIQAKYELHEKMRRAGGELAASVADVAALETELSPLLLMQHRACIQAAPIVILDGNMSPASMLVRAHLLPPPVSSPKQRAVAALAV